jgi:hypothetical protein
VKLFFDWDGKRPLDDALTRGMSEALGRMGRLRPFDELKPEEWEILAKAMSMDLALSDKSGTGDEALRFDAVAPLVAEAEKAEAALAAAKKEVDKAWSPAGERRPTRNLGKPRDL